MAPLLNQLAIAGTTEIYSAGERLRAVRHGRRIWIDEVTLPAGQLDLIRRALAASMGHDLLPMQTGHWQGYRWATGGPPASDAYVSLRHHLEQALPLESYLAGGRATREQLDLLGRPGSMILAGTTGSGKTTLLSAIINQPGWQNRRMILIEDTAELVAPVDSQRIVTSDMRLGCAHALRLLPDVIVLGEVRGPAAWDAVMAALSGHDTLVTIHASHVEMAWTRLQRLAEQTGYHMAADLVREAFPLVVVLERGARIVEISHG